MNLLKRTTTFLFLFLLLIFSLPNRAAAQEDQPTTGLTLTAQGGFDGYFKSDFWIPVHIQATNNGPAVEGEIRITIGSDPDSRITYRNPISLPTQSNKEITTYVYPTGFINQITVDLIDGGGERIARAEATSLKRLENSDLLYGVVTSNPGNLSFLDSITGGRAGAAVAYLSLNTLPEATTAWDSLDILILNDIDTSQLSTEQLTALQGWTGTGGQLIVTGGSGWQKTISGIEEMLPVNITGSQAIDDLPGLRARTGTEFRDPGPYNITTSSIRTGSVLIHEDGLPILARRNYGRGQVYFMALDPNVAPLLDWDGSEVIWSEIAQIAPQLPFWADGFKNPYSASNAAQTLPSLALPSVFLLICFLGIYVIIIGPVNYLVLKRLNRRELAWLTIPGLVILFTGCAYVSGFQLKGNDIILNQMSVAYGQVDSPYMRVNTLVGLYSPRRATYDLSLPATAMARPFTNLYGSFGGSDNSSISSIDRDNDLVVSGIRVDVSGVETFTTQNYQPTPDLDGQVTLRLEGSRFMLDITVVNNSDLTIENASLIFGSDVIGLGDLEPGEHKETTRNLNSTEASLTTTASTFGPSYATYNSPLLTHDQEILGTSSYSNNPTTYGRRQLLESLHQDIYGYGTTTGRGRIPRGVVTLVGWSEQPQINMTLDTDRSQQQIATTLYLLELPFTQTIASGRNVNIPRQMYSWEVVSESGTYSPSITDLSLSPSPSYVEFEFQPWPELQSMTVSEMQIVVNEQTYTNSAALGPQIRLWDWQEETWQALETNDGWGEFDIPAEAVAAYTGPGNRIRIRVQNPNAFSLEIKEIYPVLTGDLE